MSLETIMNRNCGCKKTNYAAIGELHHSNIWKLFKLNIRFIQIFL